MKSRMQLLHACRPTARQLQAYTGETGFDELIFLCGGRGRAVAPISSMVRLYHFLLNGEFSAFKACRVRLTGQRTRQAAKVVVEESRIALIAANGLVIAQINTFIG